MTIKLLTGGNRIIGSHTAVKYYSLMDMFQALIKISVRQVPCKVIALRAGEVTSFYADTNKPTKVLKWSARGLWTTCVPPNGSASVLKG